MARCSKWCASSLSAACVAGIAGAQAQVEWSATAGNPALPSTYAGGCAVDALGNVYLAVGEHPSSSVRVVSYDSTGALSWDRTTSVGGPPVELLGISTSPSADVYTWGKTDDDIGSIPFDDGVLVKFSSSGVHQWTRVYDGPFGGPDSFRSGAIASNGDVLVCGASKNTAASLLDVLAARYDANGTLLWDEHIDVAGEIDEGYAITELANGTIVVAGMGINPPNHADALVAALAANGALLWSRTIDVNQSPDVCVLLPPPGGTRVVVGAKTTNAPYYGSHVFELDAGSGATLWSALHFGPTGQYFELTDLQLGSDGASWIVGTGAGSVPLAQAASVLRYDGGGVLISEDHWTMQQLQGNANRPLLTLGAAGQAWIAGAVEEQPNSNRWDLQLLLSDAGGHIVSQQQLGVAVGSSEKTRFLAQAPGGRVIAAGDDTLSAEALVMQIDVTEFPDAYCTAKVTSTGCVPRVSFAGLPSASAASGFVVRASELRNDKNGLLFYGTSGANAAPFQGGTLCVAAPQARTPLQNSLGNLPPADDCSGTFALDMNAFAAGALGGSPSAALQVVGTTVHCQFWGRDGGFAPPNGTMLTNALRYTVLP